jgi:hypothetical protein
MGEPGSVWTEQRRPRNSYGRFHRIKARPSVNYRGHSGEMRHVQMQEIAAVRTRSDQGGTAETAGRNGPRAAAAPS